MGKKSIFTAINNENAKAISTDVIFDSIKSTLSNQQMNATANLFGMESIDDKSKFTPDQAQAFESFSEIRSNFASALAGNIGGAHRVDNIIGTEAISAAAMALLQANTKTSQDIRHTAPAVGPNSINYNSPFSANGTYASIAGAERFDDNIVKQYRTSTAALQLSTMNQSGYIGLAYPTVLLGPTEYGYTLTVPRGTIQSRAHIRNKDASPKDIEKLSVLAQYRSVGESVVHANTLYPVVRTENDKWLATYGQRTVTDFQGNTQTTAPLKVGGTCDYIRLTLPNGYTEFGPTAHTPSLAPGGFLKDIYLSLDQTGNDIVHIDVSGRQNARFVFENTNGLEANTERLNLEITHIFHEGNIKALDGVNESLGLRNIIEPGQKVHMVLNINATVLLETGNLTVTAAHPRINRIEAANGADVPRDKWNALQQAFDTSDARIDSVDFDIRRSNSNLEIFGDIVHVDNVLVHFETTINHPVSILTPVNAEDSPELLTMLTQAVKLNNHRMATVALLQAQQQIENLASSKYSDPVRVQGAPVGSLCYTPAFAKDVLDLDVGLSSEKSGELLNDISGSIRAKLKDMVSTTMRDSMYVQAIQSAYVVGEKQKAVKIGIITSQYIADFLQIQGDSRLLGDEYDVEIQVNPASVFDNKIMFFPTTVDNGKTETSPLQFGIGTYCPDVVYHAIATYANQTLKEVRVMNRFTPHTLGAVMGVLDIQGITNAVTKRVRKDVRMVP